MSRVWRGRVWAVVRGAILIGLQAGTSSSRSPRPQSLVVLRFQNERPATDADADCTAIRAVLDSLYAESEGRLRALRDSASTRALLAPDPSTSSTAARVAQRRRLRELERLVRIESSLLDDLARGNAAPSIVCETLPSRTPMWELYQSPPVRTAILRHLPIDESPRFSGPVWVY